MSNDKNKEKLSMRSRIIDRVTEYKYVGQIVSFEDKMGSELKSRTTKAWAHRDIFDSKINTEGKIKILESCIYPVLTYGAQT